MQVLQAQRDRVDPQLAGEHVDAALDQVDRLGDPERAGVGHAARRLVRVGAGHVAVRGLDVVGAGEHREEPGRVAGGLGGGVERAVVGDHVDGDREDAPVAGGGHAAAHRVVAGEPGRHQVLAAVLHPLHRPAEAERGGDRAHVPRIHRHLVAEAAAHVGRDDPDPVLGEPRDGGVERTVGVRRLRRAPHGQPLGHAVIGGHGAAGLHRRRVRAREHHLLLDHHLGPGEGARGGLGVAGLPVEHVIAALAHLRRAGGERRPGVDHGIERLVVDVDQLERVAGGVVVVGHHERHLLALEAHLVGGQHGLGVGRQRGHPGQPARLEVGARENGVHARMLKRGGGIDRDDAGVRERAPQDGAVQHPGQRQVVDVAALPADEPRVLLALERPVAHVSPLAS